MWLLYFLPKCLLLGSVSGQYKHQESNRPLHSCLIIEHKQPESGQQYLKQCGRDKGMKVTGKHEKSEHPYSLFLLVGQTYAKLDL